MAQEKYSAWFTINAGIVTGNSGTEDIKNSPTYMGAICRYRYIDNANGTAKAYIDIHPYAHSKTYESFQKSEWFFTYQTEYSYSVIKKEGPAEYYKPSTVYYNTPTFNYNSWNYDSSWTDPYTGETLAHTTDAEAIMQLVSSTGSVDIPYGQQPHLCYYNGAGGEPYGEYVFMTCRDTYFYGTARIDTSNAIVPYFSNIWIHTDTWHRGIPWAYTENGWKQGSIGKVYNGGWQ